MPVELGAVATPGTAIIKQGADGVRIASGSALDVQTLDVARPFPDGVDGRLTVQTGEDALFYIAIAAQAFLGLVYGSICPLAYLVFGHRRGNAGQHGGLIVTMAGPLEVDRQKHG